MSSFTDPLEVRKTDGKYWETTRDMTYAVGSLDSHLYYTVPAGYRTDFASIPRLFWTLVGHPAGKYAQAAVLHDWLCQTGVVSRKRADALFLESMGVLGVPWLQRRCLWIGVRIGAWLGLG